MLCGFLLFISCVNADNRPQPRLTTKDIFIATGGGAVTVSAEFAVTDSERAKGMMRRSVMNDGEGMLFVYDRDIQMSFWMKNTLVPLSIAFISSRGEILEIRDMEPEDTRSVKSERYCRYALEVPRGWFARAGVQPGNIITGLVTVQPSP
ncbi:MAG: DUF192 domain-containing protein [Spirochaetaceae bacterium]|jgi:uncharacterized membrane protein (UPF0127 family)|nr:DUF192 domain-containing protein [Spirochaetaceae bacterium]